ncbi:YbaN family protein [Holdemania massiliensis]
MKRTLLISLGTVSLILGALGAVLPLLPTVPFLLFSVCCYAKSSKRLHTWLLNTALYKQNLESYVQGKGMTARTKLRIMTAVTLMMALGWIMMSRVPVGQFILLGVWLFHVLYFIFGIRTLPENEGKVPITEAEEEF